MLFLSLLGKPWAQYPSKLISIQSYSFLQIFKVYIIINQSTDLWTSIKIKISMTSVYKVYEIKTEMIHE